MTTHVAPGARGALTAITLKVLSVTIFVAMSSLIKAAGDVPAGEIDRPFEHVGSDQASCSSHCRPPGSVIVGII